MADKASWVNRRYGTQRGYIRHVLALLEHYSGTSRSFRNPELKQVKRLVFVCLGNICRSAYAHHYAARVQDFPVASFGLSTSTNSPCNPVARKIADARGIDMSAHRTTDMSDFDMLPGDLLLVMELRQARRLLPEVADRPGVQLALLGNWCTPVHPHIHDPHTLSEAYFDTCFQLIENSINKLHAELMASQRPDAN